MASSLLTQLVALLHLRFAYVRQNRHRHSHRRRLPEGVFRAGQIMYIKYLDYINTRLAMDQRGFSWHLVGKYSGLDIACDKEQGTMHITQSDYIDTIVRSGINDFTKMSTPAPAELKVSLHDCSEELNTASHTLMRSITSSAA